MKALAEGTYAKKFQYGLGVMTASDGSGLVPNCTSAAPALGSTPGAK